MYCNSMQQAQLISLITGIKSETSFQKYIEILHSLYLHSPNKHGKDHTFQCIGVLG